MGPTPEVLERIQRELAQVSLLPFLRLTLPQDRVTHGTTVLQQTERVGPGIVKFQLNMARLLTFNVTPLCDMEAM